MEGHGEEKDMPKERAINMDVKKTIEEANETRKKLSDLEDIVREHFGTRIFPVEIQIEDKWKAPKSGGGIHVASRVEKDGFVAFEINYEDVCGWQEDCIVIYSADLEETD